MESRRADLRDLWSAKIHDVFRLVHVLDTTRGPTRRRECLDNLIVLNAAGLRRVDRLRRVLTRSRTHLALEMDASLARNPVRHVMCPAGRRRPRAVPLTILGEEQIATSSVWRSPGP